MMRVFVLAAIIAANITAFGAVNVTASRDYVDRKVEAVSNNLTKAIQDAEPGNYNIVSNKAMTAIQSIDPATNYANTAVGNLRTDLTTGTTTVKKASTLVTEGGVQKTAEQIISDISERTSTNDVRGIVTARSESGYTDWVISFDPEELIQYFGDMKVLPWGASWNLYKGEFYGSDKVAGAQGNRDSTNLSWSVAFAPGEYGTVSATRSRISTNTLSLVTYDDIDNIPSMTVARADTYGTKYRWTDSTGCVWQVSSDVWKDHWEITPKDRSSGMCVFWDGDSWVFQYEGHTQDTGIGSSVGSFSVDALGVQCKRYPGGDTVLVTRMASTNDVESIAIGLARNKSLMWVSDMGILKCSQDCSAWVGNLNVNGNSIGATLQNYVDFFWMFLTYNGTRLRYEAPGTVSSETITLSNPINTETEEYADSYPFQSVTFRRREANGLGLPDFENFDEKQDLLPYPTNQIPYSAIYNPPWLTSFTESDPTIYSWAKASTKPSYSWSEISGTANVSMFNNDVGYLKASYAAPVFDPTSTTRLQTDEVISIGDRIYRVDFPFKPSIYPDPVEEEVVTELPDLKSLNEHILKQSFLAFGSGGTNLPSLKKIHVGYDEYTGRSAYLTLLTGGIEFDTSYANESFRLLNGKLSYTDSGWSSFTEIDIRNILSSVNVVDFSNTYLNESYKKNPTSPYYVWRYLNEKYISSNDVELVYLKKSDAASTYLSKADAASTYATPSDVSESVQSAIGGVEIEYIYDWTGRYRTSQDGTMHRKTHNGWYVAFTNSNNGVYLRNAGVNSWICDNNPFGETLHFTRSNGVISCSEVPQLTYTEAYNGDCYINFPVLGGFTAIMPSGSPGEFYWEEYGEFAKKDEVPSSSTLTNAVRSIVSVTSSYIWDAQEECLYRREMKAGYLYWTPVTNVNALLPENISVLNYLEEHKND